MLKEEVEKVKLMVQDLVAFKDSHTPLKEADEPRYEHTREVHSKKKKLDWCGTSSQSQRRVRRVADEFAEVQRTSSQSCRGKRC